MLQKNFSKIAKKPLFFAIIGFVGIFAKSPFEIVKNTLFFAKKKLIGIYAKKPSASCISHTIFYKLLHMDI